MAVGTIDTSILTDIANAIRYQNGTATLYKPRQMAAAVAALDGTDAGNYQAQPYKALESGVLSERVFEDIADAIRGQNGESTLYRPEDMAPAILALEWDVGYKVRALLLTNGTLEFNYCERRYSATGGTIQQVFEVDTAGYSSASARSWDSIKLLVKRVYIDSSISDLGITNCSYWFDSFQNCIEIYGFENLSGITSCAMAFTSCSNLETIYATSFASTGLSGTWPFNGCQRLVGGTDCFVPANTSAASVLKLGAGGVLTDPNSDNRTWVWGHLYGDGELQVTTSSTPDATREVLATGRVCANAHYTAIGAMPWYDQQANLKTVTFLSDLAAVTIASMDYWFYTELQMTSLSGWANVRGLASARYLFNGCTGLVTLDLRGLDPSALKDFFYTFAGCSNPMTILVDSTWALASGASGMGAFYNCKAIVGDNGTAYSSSAYGYARAVIDKAGQAGYLTAA